MIVSFKVDENYIKNKIKDPFSIVKSNAINNGVQFLIHKDKEICGYIRIYLKKDDTSNIDFSQIKNNRLEIESYFLDNTVKLEEGTRIINKSVSFNSTLDCVIIQEIISDLKIKGYKEQILKQKKLYKLLTTTIIIFNNGTITIQGKENKQINEILDFIVNKRIEKSYNTLKSIFEANQDKMDINYDEFKKTIFSYHDKLVKKYNLEELVRFLYSNDVVELLDALTIYQIVLDKKCEFLNYAQIVRPLGITYEGFLLKLLYSVGELPADFYLSSDKIKNSKLGSYLKSNVDNLKEIFPTLKRTNSSLIDLLEPYWQKSRNDLFHSDPLKPPIIDFDDAEIIILQILEIMRDLLTAYTLQFDDTKKIEKEGFFSAIGIDESGKGDLFGPLITVSAYVPGDVKLIAFLVNSGVKDSKKIADENILKLFDLINNQKEIFWKDVTIKPKKYNELYNKMQNLNRLLAWEHARSLENLLNELSTKKITCETVIADQFEDNGLVEKSLMTLGKKIHLIKTPKAESNISVAVASIIARALFIKEIDKLSEEFKSTVPKGAGRNVVDFTINLKAKIGVENLDNYIKMHFKNVKEVIDK